MNGTGRSGRRAVLAALPLLLWRPAGAAAAETPLPLVDSLADSARLAGAAGEPLVLLVSLPGCPYCELVRRNYLLPMRKEGLAAWQIDIHDRRRPVRDFSGRLSTGAALAASWGIRITPTVLFLDARGREIAARLEGIAVPDFYGAYLDRALQAARENLEHRPAE